MTFALPLGARPRVNYEDGILGAQIGWWGLPFGSRSQVQNFADLSPNDNKNQGPRPHGLLKSGCGWTNGTWGPMMSFDGSANAYVDLGTTALIDVSTAFSLFWIERTTTSAGAPGLFVFCPSNAATQKFIILRIDSGSYKYLACGLANTGVGPTIPAFPTAPSLASGINVDRRMMLVCRTSMSSLTAADYTLYVDETSYSASSGAGLSSFTGSTNYIGWDSLDNNWTGAIGCVRMWSRALKSSEITRVFREPWCGLAPTRRMFTSSAGAQRYDRMFVAM